MARPPVGVDGHIAQARADKDRSAARRRAASQARLAELLLLNSPDQFAHLDDPTLLPDDRSTLRRSIDHAFQPARRMPKRLWKRRWITPHLRKLALRTACEPLVACPVLILVVSTFVAWHNTAVSVRLEQDVPFTISLLDEVQSGTFGRGGIVPAFLDRRGGAVLRHWFPGFGYSRIPAPPGSFSIPSDEEVKAAQQGQRSR